MGAPFYGRNDRRVILGLAFLAFLFLGLIFLLDDDHMKSAGGNGGFMAADSGRVVKSFPRRYGYEGSGARGRTDDYVGDVPSEKVLESFDPNTADSTTLLRLGLRAWQVRNIYRYRARGGVYRTPADFARLYGLSVAQFRQLEPYIRISSDFTTPASALFPEKDKAEERDTLRYPRKLRRGETVTLDMADTAQLARVPGIGRSYARAIVAYGERLGGYASVGQLKEIEGFPDEALSYFKVGNSAVRQINVNKATLQQLRHHPYINFYQARAILDYRRMNGRIASLEELALNPNFTSADIERLRSYLSF